YMTYDASKGEHKAIQLRSCPTCKKTIFTAPRYNNIVKTQLALLARVKEKLLKAFRQEVTLEERQAINQAMSSDGWGAAAGHWFACPNGHPYFIADCGGAMVTATCPECGAVIGGANHSSAAGNTFVADFTGVSERPHWPVFPGYVLHSALFSPVCSRFMPLPKRFGPSPTPRNPAAAKSATAKGKGKGGGKGRGRLPGKGVGGRLSSKGRGSFGNAKGKGHRDFEDMYGKTNGTFSERAITNSATRIRSSSELTLILRRTLDKKNPDLCLKVCNGLREKITELLGRLDAEGMRVFISVVVMAGDAFEKAKFYQLIQTVGATLVVASSDYVNKVRLPQQLVEYTKVMVELCRWDPQSAGLVSAEVISSRARAIGGRSEQLELLMKQVVFHKEGGASRKLRGLAKPGKPEDVDVELCGELMKAANLLPQLEEIVEGPTYNKKKPRMVNRVNSMWDAKNEQDLLLYRATHYHCLRQEFVIPLKEALCPAMGIPSAYEATSRTVCYEHVKTTRRPFLISSSGNLYVQFKFSCARPVDFTLGSHLIYGSLVALFQTSTGTARGDADPETLVYATVEEFDIKKVGGDKSKGGLVGLSLSSDNLEKLSFGEEYCMLESPDYFLAKKPIFEFLRDDTLLEGMPLLPHLLGSPSQTRTPGYLLNNKVDLSPLYTAQGLVTGDPLDEWPRVSGRSIELDPAQQEALKYIFRSPLAVVQGPPGTGKSYLGVKFTRIARACLDQKLRSSPILAVTLTNHALDQFLEDLLPYHRGQIVRFGGRSKTDNPELEECNVRNKKVHEFRDEYCSRKSLKKELYRNAGTMNSVLALQERDQVGKLLGLLAFIPADLFADIVAPRECTFTFALLGSRAIEFAVKSLEVWLKGTRWQLPRLERRWIKEWGVTLANDSFLAPTEYDSDEDYAPQTAFDALPAKARKKLLREMEAGVDSFIRGLFGFDSAHLSTSEPAGSEEADALDMDIIDQIELDRRMDDDIGEEEEEEEEPEDLFARWRGDSAAEASCSEMAMSAALQSRIGSRLEAALGHGFLQRSTRVEIRKAGLDA
ncbi:hypothetical protein FOZ62_002319, partial [Perkinsus olseni]